ncbi:MAG: matrixin family metalloprotease [Deltaproteobacteria bacterium]
MNLRVLGVAVAFALFPARAMAYTCTPVPNSSPALSQVWQQRCIPYWLNPNSAMMQRSDIQQIVSQSFAVWSSNECTDLEFMDAGETDQLAGFDPDRCDNKNVIGAVENDDDLADFFDSPDLLAVTLTSFSRATGEIFDADILFNTVNFPFDDVTAAGLCQARNPRPYDIRNTLVHEIGHFIGFDHVNVEGATMFPSAVNCETEKRTLEPDDLDAVCTTYPKDAPANTCAPPADYEAGGDPSIFRDQCINSDVELCEDRAGNTCSCGTTGGRGGLWGLLILAPVLLRRRR